MNIDKVLYKGNWIEVETYNAQRDEYLEKLELRTAKIIKLHGKYPDPSKLVTKTVSGVVFFNHRWMDVNRYKELRQEFLEQVNVHISRFYQHVEGGHEDEFVKSLLEQDAKETKRKK